MAAFCSTVSQILKMFPRTEFQALVTRMYADRRARGFTCWGQVVAMLFCQLGRAHSLRTEGKRHDVRVARTLRFAREPSSSWTAGTPATRGSAS